MEALCGLFETVSCFGSIFGRSNEKTQELVSLIATMESISASVQAFARDLRPEEREEAFHSNKVFSELLRHMKLCDEVINRRCEAIERATSQQARAVSAPSRLVSRVSSTDSMLTMSGLKQGMRTGGQEVLEALSNKLGSFGTLMHLPEDELEVLKNTSAELQKLAPLLILAITAHGSRGRKRDSFSSTDCEQLGARKRPCLEDTSGDAAGRRSPERASTFFLQLVSDAHVAESCELPTLTTSSLRPAGAGASTTSLETASGNDPSDCISTPFRMLFGRKELSERVPRQFMLPFQNGASAQLQHVSRFVSRDLFRLEERLPEQESSPSKALASLDMPTLEFCGFDESGTLPMGGAAALAAVELMPLALAAVRALCKTGLHYRSSRETLWRWLAQDAETELYMGDCIALLLESPPGSFTPGPPRDLKANEVTCLLGVEFRLHRS